MGEPKQLENLSTKEMEALATIQQNVIAAPVLALPRGEGYFSLDIDECDKEWTVC